MIRLSFFTGFTLILLYSSCKPEGCTDVKAINYDSKAKKENHTCQYKAKVVFWLDEKNSAYLVEDDIESLKFYLDGKLSGSASADVFWPGAPYCGQSGAVTAEVDINGQEQRINFRVIDNTGRVIADSSKVFVSGECNELRIVYEI